MTDPKPEPLSAAEVDCVREQAQQYVLEGDLYDNYGAPTILNLLATLDAARAERDYYKAIVQEINADSGGENDNPIDIVLLPELIRDRLDAARAERDAVRKAGVGAVHELQVACNELRDERDALRKALEKILADHIVARECPVHLWNEARALLK